MTFGKPGESELIAIRVLREQEWAYNGWRARLSVSALAKRSSLAEADGGLGYGLSEAQVKKRLDGYRERMKPYLESNAVAARERQVAELAELARLAQAALAQAASAGKVDKEAARLLLEIHNREARLLGLDAPTSIVAEVVTRDAIIDELNVELAAMGETEIPRETT